VTVRLFPVITFDTVGGFVSDGLKIMAQEGELHVCIRWSENHGTRRRITFLPFFFFCSYPHQDTDITAVRSCDVAVMFNVVSRSSVLYSVLTKYPCF
jgi:hypothetical protein